MNYSVYLQDGRGCSVKNIYCVGRNYINHAKELKNPIPQNPFFFQKSLPSLNPGKSIRLPGDKKIQYEVEIVILIGKGGKDIPTETAKDHILGYTLGLDLTDRNFQSALKERRLPWLLSKSFEGSAVVAPFYPITDHAWDQDFWLTINGKTIQRGQKDQMIFPVEELISYLSHHIPLLDGDLILTGTPEGVGEIKPNDNVEMGFGYLRLASFDVS